MANTVATIDLEHHRQEFPGLANKIYFNFGGQGTMPRAALESIIDCHNFLQQQGPFSLKVNASLQQKIPQTRAMIAEILGVTSETITLTENVTAGCNIALWGIDWHSRDRLLIGDCEHPGVIAIVNEISRRFGVEIDRCPIMSTLNGGNPVEVVKQHLTPRTRLLVISHILWNTGQVLPLEEIVQLCHSYQADKPVQVLVDAAQSVGSMPLNLTQLEADYYAFTGHKWLCGPAGVGGVYIRPEAFKTLNPTFIGWRGIVQDEQGNPIDWKDSGEKFEVATSAYPQYEGLKAAIATHAEWGDSQAQYGRILQLSEYLWRSLSQVDGIQCLKNSPPESGLVSFHLTDSTIKHKDLVRNLERQGFLLRTLANPNCIRACVHYLTLPEEIEQLVQAIATSINV